MRPSSLLVLPALLLGAAVLAPRATAAPPAYKVIAHPSTAATSVERRFLSDAFLKKVTRWPTGEGIRPVDLSASTATRRTFSEEVLGRGVEAVKSYWQQCIFSGRDVPPPELDNDDDVVRYVLKHPGAVGYVGAGTNAGAAKLLVVR